MYVRWSFGNVPKRSQIFCGDMCDCSVCVCVCERDRQTDRQDERETEKVRSNVWQTETEKRQKGSLYVCVLSAAGKQLNNIGLTIPGNWSFEIRQISPGFHPWNPADFTWNLPDFMDVSFCVMIKYRSFFRKTNKRWFSFKRIKAFSHPSLSTISLQHTETQCTFYFLSRWN